MATLKFILKVMGVVVGEYYLFVLGVVTSEGDSGLAIFDLFLFNFLLLCLYVFVLWLIDEIKGSNPVELSGKPILTTTDRTGRTRP